MALCALNLYAENELLIKTDKNITSKSENIFFAITNTHKKDIIYVKVSIEKLINKKWELVRTDTTCPCLATCKKMLIPTKYLQSKKEKWDLKNNKCQNVTQGVYRVIIKSRYIDGKNKNYVLGKSNNFKIID